MENLKPEQVFVGNDGKKYVYLYQDRKDIVFSDYKNQKAIYTAKPRFVVKTTNEMKDSTNGRFVFAKSLKSLDSMSDYEIVHMLLSREKGGFIKSKDERNARKDEMKIKKIGDKLLVGEGYFHETNEYYKVIGLEIEVNRKYYFGKENDKPHEVTEVGFYSAYVGRCHEASPYNFDEGRNFGASRYNNGCGDHVEIVGTYRKLDLPEIDLSRWSVLN